MDTNKKTIQINPELFKLNGGNTTRKNNSLKNRDKNKIRMKTTDKKPQKMSTIKKNILKMIQEQQHERKKSMDIMPNDLENNNNDVVKSSSLSQKFKNEFDESLEYLSNLSKEVETKKQAYTIKRYPSVTQEPKYGCLKNGKLPTYRNWLNQTQKNYPNPNPNPNPSVEKQPQIIIQNNNNNKPSSFCSSPIIQSPNANTIMQLPNENTNANKNAIIQSPNMENTRINEQLRQISKMQQFDKIKQQKSLSPWKCPKQKRTIRRTYFVGKSKVQPRVSVLVTNKTIRARTTLKQQELKQVPMAEVKKYLLKNGFIKVGTSSPNNILREIYENAQLICGEIKNHNPENLLYNYFNSPSE